jgi:hypothetical protein
MSQQQGGGWRCLQKPGIWRIIVGAVESWRISITTFTAADLCWGDENRVSIRNVRGNWKLIDPASDDPIETLRQRLGRLDPYQIVVWRAMSPARRLELAFQAYQFALDVVRLTERQRHPDLSPDDLAWRVTRRIQGNPRLGR